MATSTLVVYEPLISFGENGEYWKEYSAFYEKYWGGPTSPFGVWFGNEYENYRTALSEHLGMDDENIQDCFFLKKDEDYYVAPLKDSTNVFSFENSIPPEWFVLFDESERKNFYSHLLSFHPEQTFLLKTANLNIMRSFGETLRQI